MSTPYTEVLAGNVRAARARRKLDQEPVATRMRALGFSAWRRQTVANVEKNMRRVTAEELLGLALALETSLMLLIQPTREDGPIGLPSGDWMPFLTVHGLIWGGSELTVTWDGDVPRFPVEEPPDGWARVYDDPIPPPLRGRRSSKAIPPRRPKSGDDA